MALHQGLLTCTRQLIAIAPSVLLFVCMGGYLLARGASYWSQVEIYAECGASPQQWIAMHFVRTVVEVVELGVLGFFTISGIQGVAGRGGLALVVNRPKALVGITTGTMVSSLFVVALLLSSAGGRPRPSVLNTSYCDWRAESACWQNPNTSLATYELLFPVTRDVLFRPERTQQFQPLETRYDVSVLWNAMTRCRDFHQSHQPAAGQAQSMRVFAQLPRNASVDAWCGTMRFPDGAQDEQLLMPFAQVVSPQDAYGATVAAACSDVRAQIVQLMWMRWVRVMICAVGVSILVAVKEWLQKKRMPLLVEVETQVNMEDIPQEAVVTPMAPAFVVDPSWVDVRQR